MVLGIQLAMLACTLAATDPFARSIQVDSGFAYYQERSRESITSEIRVNGYGAIRLAVTRDSAADAALVETCHKQGLAVWYTTFGNGTYSTGDLPQGWESWKMKLRESKANEVAGGFVYLCLNNPEYRAWKKKQVVETLKRIPFDGFEMAEPFWPAYKGPESPAYGCLCDSCRAAFLRAHPEEREIPDFADEKHPNYYKTNRELYQKWMDFRVESVISFHKDIIGAVRKECPKVKVAVWGIADDVPNPVETLREWEGIDGKALAAAIKPDVYVIQTDWPDWSNPKLPADYPLKYKPVVDEVKPAAGRIIMQADIGSSEKCRRGSNWVAECEKAAIKAGMTGITAYEYHLSADIYDAEPRPMESSVRDDIIILVFNKRLDPAKAIDLANYSADSGRILSAEVDGNLVKLKVEGKPTKITVRNLSDDPTRRLFKNHPAAIMRTPQTIAVHWYATTAR